MIAERAADRIVLEIAGRGSIECLWHCTSYHSLGESWSQCSRCEVDDEDSLLMESWRRWEFGVNDLSRMPSISGLTCLTLGYRQSAIKILSFNLGSISVIFWRFRFWESPENYRYESGCGHHKLFLAVHERKTLSEARRHQQQYGRVKGPAWPARCVWEWYMYHQVHRHCQRQRRVAWCWVG